MNEQLLKTSGADVLSSSKKLRPPPPSLPLHLYVRGLKLQLVHVEKIGRSTELSS